MKIYRILLAIIACTFVVTALPPPADSAGITFSSRRKQVNVGVAALRNYNEHGFTTGTAKTNWYPYVFYVMDRRADMKPRGWEFINPLAEPQFAKNSRDYWELDLERVSLNNLTRLDVLYICADSSIGFPLRFPMHIRDKLRLFVDAGGVLWIDNPGPAGGGGLVFDDNPANVFFITDPGKTTQGGSAHPWIYERHHPLVTSPFWLTPQDAAFMGLDSNGGGRYWLDQTVPPAFPPIISIGNDTSKAYVGAIEYGSGKVVVTAGGIGGGMGPNWSGVDRIDPQPDDFELQRISRPPSLKMAYNIVNWATSYTGFRKNARHSGYAPEGMSPGQVERWRLESSPGGSETGVAILKDVFFYTGIESGGGYKLWALDGIPETDLDMDGNPDDGQVDPANVNYDIIWEQGFPEPVSAPVAFTAQYGSDTIECVMVQTASGRVLIFQAFPSANGRLSGTPNQIGGFQMMGGSGTRVFAPVFFNNKIYASGGDGALYGISFEAAVGGGTPWKVPHTAHVSSPYSQQPLIGAPTVGFVEHKTNGALVAMVFTLAEPQPRGRTDVVPNDHIMGVPVFVSGERLTRRDTNSNYTFLTTYSDATPGWQEGTEPKGTAIDLDPARDIIVKDSLGHLYSDYVVRGVNSILLDEGGLVNAPGKIVVGTTSGEPLPNDCQVFVTYSLEYGDTSLGNSINPRLYHALPPQLPSTGGRVQAIATPAMGTSGTLYVSTESTDGTGSSIYALTYEGGERGDKMLTDWIYRLSPDWSSFNPFDTEDWATLERWAILGPDDLPLYNLAFMSSPAVAKDKVYATASGSNGGALLVFKAKSDFVIRVNQASPQASFTDTTTGRPRNIRIWQPDPANRMGNPILEAASVPQHMIDREHGTITITDFSSNNLVIRRGAAGVDQVFVPITPALPVTVLVNNVVIPQDQVDTSSWDNLLWYYVPEHDGGPCSGIDSPPTVIGDRVYFVCNDGWMFSLDASPGISRHGRLTDDSAQGNIEKKLLGGPAGGICQSISASNGLMGVVTSRGLHALDNPITLIADANRAIEIDGSGQPMWACDAVVARERIPGTTVAGAPMVGMRKQSINRPSRIRSFGPSDYLVVNSGNDEVVRMTRSGDVTASVKTFTDNYRRLLKSGEPLQLRGPTDATVWMEREGDFYVYHWLVADAGNHRIVDLVQRFTMDGARVVRNLVTGEDTPTDPNAPPELNWVSLSTDIGRNYRFNSLQIVNQGREIWVAAGNWTVGEYAYGVPGGSIVKFAYRGGTPGNWNYVPGQVVDQIDTITPIRGPQIKLSNPRHLRIYDVHQNGTASWRAIICDSRGVFEIDPHDDRPNRVVWSLTNKRPDVDMGGLLYQEIPRNIDGTLPNNFVVPNVIKLDAAHVQRLPNNDLLITNSHSESDAAGNRFSGEVIQVRRPMTGEPASIVWYAPRMEWVPDPNDPSIGRLRQKMIGTYNLTQPMSAERVR